MDVLPALLLFLLPIAAFSINIAPKVDFGDKGEGKSESPGITPEYIKSILEKDSHPEVNLSPGTVKAVLEVNVGGLVTNKPTTKTDSSSSEKKKKKKNEVLICTLDGKCKLLTVDSGEDDDEHNESGDNETKTLKPIIVSDFDVDPSTENNSKGGGKKEGHGHHQQVDRLPAYYGMKLSPEFHQPYPTGPVIYEEEPHYPPHSGSYPDYPYGVNSYPSYPRYPHEHGVSYLYPRVDNQYPSSDFPQYGGGSKQYYPNSFSGASGPRTPSPYGKFHPTSSPNWQPIITPLHRRVGGGGGDWSTRPGVSWPTTKRSTNLNGLVGSNSPGLHWTPNQESSVAVRGKMDEDSLKGGDRGPKDPTPPNRPGEVTVDGKLGEPLDKNES